MTRRVFWGVLDLRSQPDNVEPTLLLVGDSWFWYPFDNLAIEIGAKLSQQVLLVIGRNGSEAGEWATTERKDIERAFDWYAAGVRGLLLSGGGNDIAGLNDFLRLLKPDCSQAKIVADCYRPGQPAATLSGIEGAYRAVIEKFHAHNPGAPVFVHQYDHAWPTGQGVFGPSDWLKEPMDAAQVPRGLRRPLFKDLIRGLRDMQLGLSMAATPRVVVVESAGTLPEDTSMWANELHPTPAGFRLLARKAFVPAIKAEGIA